jgi:hypothetical protein
MGGGHWTVLARAARRLAGSAGPPRPAPRAHGGGSAERPRPGAPTATKGKAVIYLIVGLDKKTLVPWHQNIGADDVTAARRLARARATAQGINLLVAAVIGPNMSVLSDTEGESATGAKAA